MNFNSEFNKENLLGLYSQNKQFMVPVLAIIISIFLLIFFVLPQVLAFPSRKAEADQESIRLNKIQGAYDLLTKIDEQTVNLNLVTAQQALPDKKDFGSVLNAISTAAGNSSTQIFDYTFQDIAGTQNKYSTLSFKIKVLGGVKEAVSFINELYRVYPLSSVVSLSNSSNITEMEIVFYYRAFPPITVDDRLMVTKMDQKQQDALKTISEWESTNAELEIPTEASASSSTTPF